MDSINKDEVGRVIAIRYRGKAYDHYGILDGYSNVIHVNKKRGMITSDPLYKVLRGAKTITYIDDDFDTRWNQYQYASTLIGSAHQYRFFTDNCESWVQKIRTGRAFSRQVDNLSHTIATSILGISILLGLGNAFGQQHPDT